MIRVDPAMAVILGETSTQSMLTPTYGRADDGNVARTHNTSITCSVAICLIGTHAPCMFSRVVTGELFVRWLVPTLHRGMTVVRGNFRVHSAVNMRAVNARAGCRLIYLPSSSPDHNPIELAFSKLMVHLRTVTAQTVVLLFETIGTGLTSITTTDITGHYRHCGVDRPKPEPQP